MATTPKPVAIDETTERRRMRSPACPFINLETAIKRAKEFHAVETRNAASLKVAVKHWGYEEKSSGGLQTVAALISFGLMKDEGIGAKRKLQLTPNAIRLLLDERPDSAQRAELIKQMALTPKIHSDLWQKYGSSLPSEDQLRYELTVEWEPPFNKNSVDSFIKEYKDTIAFAKLSESDKLGTEDGGGDKPTNETYVPKVGDYVQWESQGELRLPEPRRVREVLSDGEYVYVEGSYTGIPVSQLIKEKAPFIVAPIPAVPNSGSPKMTMQEFVVPLSSGRAVFQWPNVLTKEDVADLRDSLGILERKIARRAKAWKMTPGGNVVCCTVCSWTAPMVEQDISSRDTEFNTHSCEDYPSVTADRKK